MKRSVLLNFFSTIHSCPICQSKHIFAMGNKRTINPDDNLHVQIMKCSFCNHWFTNPLPSQNFLNKSYLENSLFVMDNNFAKNVKKSNQEKKIDTDSNWIVKSLIDHPPKNFLEIGPGDGSLLRKFKVLGWRVFGVDLGKYAHNPHTVISPTKLPKNILFNVIVLQDVLEHAANPKKILQLYLKFLAPKAIIFIAVPWSGSKRARIFGLNWQMVRPLGHLHYFDMKSMDFLLKSLNFKIIEMNSVNIYGSYYKNIFKSFLKIITTLLRPDKWRNLNQRIHSLIAHLKFFPGDSKGDQLYVKAIKIK